MESDGGGSFFCRRRELGRRTSRNPERGGVDVAAARRAEASAVGGSGSGSARKGSVSLTGISNGKLPTCRTKDIEWLGEALLLECAAATQANASVFGSTAAEAKERQCFSPAREV